MKYWIKGLQKDLGITTIYVTHDQSEALTMSDRIGVMSKGRVVQVGTPTEIYETPSDLFVTTFIGESNLLDGTVQLAPFNRSRSPLLTEAWSWRRLDKGSPLDGR